MSGSNALSARNELSYNHARFLAKELKERFRVSISIGGLVEELSDIEIIIGKSLVKVS
jgi:hypothetical protein